MAEKALDVVLNVFKSVSPRDIVEHDAAVGIAEVGAGDRAIPLLAGCVPDLQFDDVIVHFHGFYFEVNSDGTRIWLEDVV